jgi:hypothetical protein
VRGFKGLLKDILKSYSTTITLETQLKRKKLSLITNNIRKTNILVIYSLVENREQNFGLGPRD